MDDPNASGPKRSAIPTDASKSQDGSRNAYESYSRSEKKSKKLAYWLFFAAVFIAIPALQHFLRSGNSAMQAASTSSTANGVVDSAPALAADAVHLKADLLIDFNRYMDLAEKPTPQTAVLDVQGAETKLENSAKNLGAIDPGFVSLVSRCYIDGHDIHFILPDGKILSHVPTGAPLPPLLGRARDVILATARADTRVFVYKDKIQITDASGKLISEEPANAKGF